MHFSLIGIHMMAAKSPWGASWGHPGGLHLTTPTPFFVTVADIDWMTPWQLSIGAARDSRRPQAPGGRYREAAPLEEFLVHCAEVRRGRAKPGCRRASCHREVSERVKPRAVAWCNGYLNHQSLRYWDRRRGHPSVPYSFVIVSWREIIDA